MIGSWVFAGITLLAADMVAAEQLARRAPPPGSRTVQLISMNDGAANDAWATASAGNDVRDATRLRLFQIHDLSRRWVGHQMRTSLSASNDRPVLVADDPFAPQQKAALSFAIGAGISPTANGVRSSVGSPASPSKVAGSLRYAPGCNPMPYRPSGFLDMGAEARRQILYGLMSSVACEYGLPIGLFDAMIIRESRYDPAIVSAKNAFGLTQLMPQTAAGLGVNRYSVEDNLRGGASYLRRQLNRYGQVHLALAAYNAGPGRVGSSVPAIAETQAYVSDILKNWSRLSDFVGARPTPSGSPAVAVEEVRTMRGATVLAF